VERQRNYSEKWMNAKYFLNLPENRTIHLCARENKKLSPEYESLVDRTGWG
jgi:hypothetical protein